MQIKKREEIKKKDTADFFLRRMLRQMQEESQNGVSSFLFFLNHQHDYIIQVLRRSKRDYILPSVFPDI